MPRGLLDGANLQRGPGLVSSQNLMSCFRAHLAITAYKNRSLIWSPLPYRSLIRGCTLFFGDHAMRLAVYASFRPAPREP